MRVLPMVVEACVDVHDASWNCEIWSDGHILHKQTQHCGHESIHVTWVLPTCRTQRMLMSLLSTYMMWKTKIYLHATWTLDHMFCKSSIFHWSGSSNALWYDSVSWIVYYKCRIWISAVGNELPCVFAKHPWKWRSFGSCYMNEAGNLSK
jgi:hypothetical protein